MTGQKKLLLILLGLLGIALFYAFTTTPRPVRVESGPPEGAVRTMPPAAPTAQTIGPEGNALTLDEETQELAEEPEVNRNIFAPLFPMEPPPPPEPELAPSPEVADLPPPPPPPPPFRLLGYMQKNRETIFFLTQENEIFIVKPLERFGPENRYRITDVYPEQVTLEELGSGEKTMLRITAGVSSIEAGGARGMEGDYPFQQPPDEGQPRDQTNEEELFEEPSEPPSEELYQEPDEPAEEGNGPAENERSPLAPGLITPDINGDDEDFVEEEGATPVPPEDERPEEVPDE